MKVRPRPRATRTRPSYKILSPVLDALERFDYAGTDREICRLANAIADPREFVHQVALPLMHTIGERWHDGRCSIAQEHILTRHLTALLTSLVRSCSRPDAPARVLLATPRHELHEFPLLAAAMLTAAGGLGVVYVGSDLPAADIVLAARRTDAAAVLLSVSTAPGTETLKEFRYIARNLPRSTALWVGGPPELRLDPATVGSRWVMLHDFSSFERQLSTLGAWY